VDHPMKNGGTALMVACIGGHVDLVRLLLGYGAAIDREIRVGTTALTMAAFYQQSAVESVLLNNGANTPHLYPHGQIELLLACVDLGQDLGVMLLESADAQMPPLPSESPPARESTRQDRPVRPGYTKLFVGEVGRSSSEDSVRGYFGQFGDVDRVVVKHHASSKSASSFAFVVINGDIDMIMNAAHVIDGHKVAAPEIARQTRTKNNNGTSKSAQDWGCRKIFVGGLSHQTKETVLRSHFSTFGEVIDAVVLHDPGGGRPRGFGFVTFADAESALSVISYGRYHHVDGRHVEVKLAIPKAHMPADGTPGNTKGGSWGSDPMDAAFEAGIPAGWM